MYLIIEYFYDRYWTWSVSPGYGAATFLLFLSFVDGLLRSIPPSYYLIVSTLAFCKGKACFFWFFYFWFLVLVYVCWSFLKTLRLFVPTGSYRSPSFLTTSLVLLSVYKLPGCLRQSKLSLYIIIFPFISYRIKRWTVSYRVMIHFGTMILWGDWYWSNSSSLRLFVNVQTPVHVFPFHQYPSI